MHIRHNCFCQVDEASGLLTYEKYKDTCNSVFALNNADLIGCLAGQFCFSWHIDLFQAVSVSFEEPFLNNLNQEQVGSY